MTVEALLIKRRKRRLMRDGWGKCKDFESLAVARGRHHRDMKRFAFPPAEDYGLGASAFDGMRSGIGVPFLVCPKDSMSTKLSIAAAAALALSVPATALAQALPYKDVEAPATWEVNVGGGPVYGFSPGGKDPHKTNFTFWGSAHWKGRLYANGLDGVGYNLVNDDTLHVGAQLRPRWGGRKDTESGVESPDMGADLALYAYKRTWNDWVVGARAGRDVTGVSDGWDVWGSISRQDITPVGLLQSMVYARGADKNTNQTYYGVSARDAAALPALEAYDPKGGLNRVGVAFLMMTPIGDKYAIGTFANYERILGEAADSPLIERYGQQDEYRGGLIVVRRFIGPRAP